MKKFVSILLFCLMLYNIMGYYIAYMVMIEEAKNEMAGETDDQNVITIRLPYTGGTVQDKNFELIDEDEFTYQGKMYDISRTEIEDGYINFYCINDSREDNINLALVNHVQNNTDSGSQAEKKSNNVLNNLIKEYLPLPELLSSVINGECKDYTTEHCSTLTGCIEIASPPPRSN